MFIKQLRGQRTAIRELGEKTDALRDKLWQWIPKEAKAQNWIDRLDQLMSSIRTAAIVANGDISPKRLVSLRREVCQLYGIYYEVEKAYEEIQPRISELVYQNLITKLSKDCSHHVSKGDLQT